MSLLIESIYLKDGVFRNLSYHQRRLSQARLELFGLGHEMNLEYVLSEQTVPHQGLFKCRIIYDEKIRSIEFNPYIVRPIESLKLVEDNLIEYNYKFHDRKSIDDLYARKGDCDDILIIKNGFVTDTSYSNILFKNELGWFTPSAPLLKGAMRSQLLEQKVSKECVITRDNIYNFTSFKLINAMIGFEMNEIPIKNIQK